MLTWVSAPRWNSSALQSTRDLAMLRRQVSSLLSTKSLKISVSVTSTVTSKNIPKLLKSRVEPTKWFIKTSEENGWGEMKQCKWLVFATAFAWLEELKCNLLLYQKPSAFRLSVKRWASVYWQNKSELRDEMPEVTLSFDLDYRVICVKLPCDLRQVAARFNRDCQMIGYILYYGLPIIIRWQWILCCAMSVMLNNPDFRSYGW